jgi:hypothetical protein
LSLSREVTPLIRPLPPKADPLIRPDFTCTEIVKYYIIVPLKRDHPSYKATPTKGHPSYQTRFHMYWSWDSKYYIIVPLKRSHPSYQTRFHMYWDSKILHIIVTLKRGHLSYKDTFFPFAERVVLLGELLELYDFKSTQIFIVLKLI